MGCVMLTPDRVLPRIFTPSLAFPSSRSIVKVKWTSSRPSMTMTCSTNAHTAKRKVFGKQARGCRLRLLVFRVLLEGHPFIHGHQGSKIDLREILEARFSTIQRLHSTPFHPSHITIGTFRLCIHKLPNQNQTNMDKDTDTKKTGSTQGKRDSRLGLAPHIVKQRQDCCWQPRILMRLALSRKRRGEVSGEARRALCA